VLTGGCSVNAGACAGDLNQVSFLVDYTFTKHFDVYAGVSYQNISGGLAHSLFSNDPYNATDNTTFVSGLRLKF
jgi:predicted porin